MTVTGYGADTWCLDAYQPGRLASGATLVAQALYRRLTTPRGMLQGGDDEQEYGFDVSAYIGEVDTPTALAALPALVAAECRKDERVANVVVTSTLERTPEGATSITLELRVTLADGSTTFPLTLAASEVGVEIIGSLPL